MTQPGDYVTVSEAAETLGLTRQAILRRIQRGRLPAQKFGPVWMIRRADLDAWAPQAPGRKPRPQ